jgi:hypothetical protein
MPVFMVLVARRRVLHRTAMTLLTLLGCRNRLGLLLPRGRMGDNLPVLRPAMQLTVTPLVHDTSVVLWHAASNVGNYVENCGKTQQ